MAKTTLKDKPELKEFNKELTKVKKELTTLKVTNESSFKEAAAIKKELTTQIRKIKEFFKPMEDDARKVLRTIQDQRKSLVEPREAFKGEIVDQMAKYQIKRDDARKAAETRAAAKASEGAPVAVRAGGTVKAAGVGTTITWELDPDQLVDVSKVPKKYLMLDEKAVLADIKAANGDITIPGVTFRKKAIIR